MKNKKLKKSEKRLYLAGFLSIVFLLGFVDIIFAYKYHKSQQTATTVIRIQIRPTNKINYNTNPIQRDSILTETRVVLVSLMNEPSPENLNVIQEKEWKQQEEWLNSVYERISVYQKKLRLYFQQNNQKKTRVGSGMKITEDNQRDIQMTGTTAINNEFFTLQDTIKDESKQFLILSHAVRVRQDIAMDTICNIE